MKNGFKNDRKIPGKVLIKINQKVGFRLVTKFGSKGIFEFLGNWYQSVGAIVGGGLELYKTRIIASNWLVFKTNYNNY